MRIVVFTLPKTRKVLICLATILTIIFLVSLLVRAVYTKSTAVTFSGLALTGKTFIIDPGHGGYDPGVWRNDIEEKAVTLEIALVLRDVLQSAGARVVMTRESDRDLLVLPTAGPKKKQDMKNRLIIITNTKPDYVISIHANAISSSRWRGAQVFFQSENEESKTLARTVQQEMTRILANTDRQTKPGNYFILNETDAPAILVETGFISNPQEARLLADPAYQCSVAWAIYLGIIKHVETGGTPSS